MYKLLIVDDDPIIRESLRTRFNWREMGFEVLAVCEDGNEALDIIQREPVDALLTDIVMYDVSGIDIARFIDANGLLTKIVFLSGYQEFEYAKKGIQYGVFDFLLKPISYDELRRCFHTLARELDRRIQGPPRRAAWPEDAAPPLIKPDEDVARVKEYIQTHLRERLTADALADLAHLSPRQLSRKFLTAEGQTIGKYILSVRLQKALELLLENRMTIPEVADAVGFSDEKYFRRVFIAYFGYSVKNVTGSGRLGAQRRDEE